MLFVYDEELLEFAVALYTDAGGEMTVIYREYTVLYGFSLTSVRVILIL